MAKFAVKCPKVGIIKEGGGAGLEALWGWCYRRAA